jgi:hypothetical protein
MNKENVFKIDDKKEILRFNNNKNKDGCLQLKINEAIIFRENISDSKLKEILDDNIKFDRIFQAYLKLHTKT